MIGVILFIGFWVVVGLTLFLIAISGGAGGARERVFQSQSRRGRRTTAVVIVIVCLAFGVALPALVIANDEHQTKAGRTDIKLTAAEKRGRELFEEERDAGLAETLREELVAIERAEERLMQGTYGLSVETGEPIPDDRLEAVPWAERTVEEQGRYDQGS